MCDSTFKISQRGKGNTMSWTLCIVVACVVSTTFAADGFTLQQINNTAGIFFTPLGSVQLTYDRWNLCFYYDLSTFYDEMERLKGCVNSLGAICDDRILQDQGATHGLCLTIVNQLRAHLQTAEYNTELMESFGPIKSRKSRAPLEIGGKIFSYLFGVLDADDGRKYTQDINRLLVDRQYETELQKQQVSIIQESIKIHNQSFTDLGRKLDEVIDQIGVLKESWFRGDLELHLLTQFNMLAHAATLTLSHHEHMSDTLIKLLASTLQGKFLDIIPFQKLKSKLIEISKVLPGEKELPIDPYTENTHQIFLLSRVKTLLIGRKLLIEVAFPVIWRENFDMFVAIPIPVQNSQNSFITKPKSDYFLANRKLTHYQTITEAERNACVRRVRGGLLICTVTAPLENNYRKICELQLLRENLMSDEIVSCNMINIPTNNYVVSLLKTNAFYVSLAEPVHIRTVCRNSTANEQLNESGILRVEPGCTIESTDFTLKAQSEHTLTDDEVIIPQVNPLPINFQHSTGNFTGQQTTYIDINGEDYEKLSHRLDLVKAGQRMREQMTTYENKQTITSWVSTIIFILVVTSLLVFWVLYIKGFTKYKKVLSWATTVFNTNHDHDQDKETAHEKQEATSNLASGTQDQDQINTNETPRKPHLHTSLGWLHIQPTPRTISTKTESI